MVSNLEKIKNNLRAIAKRCKTIKYSAALVVTYAMLGANAFSEEAVISTSELKAETSKLSQILKEIQEENDKKLKGVNLELTQLMEQGDQVVKSPWASWQFGMNYMYDDYSGSYKGRGGKKETKIFRRDNSMGRYEANVSEMKSGTIELAMVREPDAEIEVSTGIVPKDTNKEAPKFSLAVPIGSIPHFEPRLAKSPNVEPLNITINPAPTPPATDVGYQDVPKSVSAFDMDGTKGNNGIISELNLTSGTYDLYMKGASNYNIDYTFSNINTSDTGFINQSKFVSGVDGSVSRNAFYGMGGRDLGIIDSSVIINAVGNNSTNEQLNSIFYLGNNEGANNQESKLINRGTVNLYGNKIVVVNIDNVDSSGDITFENMGNVIGHAARGTYKGQTGSSDIGNFIFGAFSYGDRGTDTIKNQGTVKFYAPGSVGWVYSSDSAQNVKRSSINNGVMELHGYNSLGIATDNSTTSTQIAYSDTQLNTPIKILGDKSIGASIGIETDNSSNNFENSKWNIEIGGLSSSQDVNYGNFGSGDTKKVEESTGLNFDFANATGNDVLIKKYRVILKDDTSKSTAIKIGKAAIKLNDSDNFSEVKLGGNKNIAILTAEGNSKLTYENTKNSITLTGNGEENIIFAAINGSKIDVNEHFNLKKDSQSGSTYGEKFVSAYAKDANSKIEFKKGLSLNHIGNKTTGLYATDGGSIVLTNTVPSSLPTITAGTIIENSNLPSTGNSRKKIKIKGNGSVGLFTNNGGKIENENSIIKLENASSLAYSKGTNSSINIKNSVLDYLGEGYAFYTESGGKIDADNSILVLRDKGLGMNAESIINGDISMSNGKIVMMSNVAIPFNVKNIPALAVNNILTGIGIPSSITIVSGKDGSTVYNNYKKASIDGIGLFNINQNLNKSHALIDSNEISSDPSISSSYNFYKRYLIQRANMQVNNKNIIASLSNLDLNKLNENTVVALELNSSNLATTNNETQINLSNNSTVIADRKDSGNGTIGLFINYGKVNVDNSSKILVEKEANVVNSRAVGIYSVNGSEVNNEGAISVGGKNSIGILGIVYRTDSSGNVIVDEFGSGALGQGLVSISNKGNISLDGESAIGIFTRNNKSGTTFTNAVAVNDTTGKITLTGNKAVGMLGEKANLINKGTIEINGQEGTGILVKDASQITNSGNIKLVSAISAGKSNIGIFSNDQNTKVYNNNGTIEGGNNTFGIYGKFIEMNSGKIKVGDNSVGIFSDAIYATSPLASNVYVDSNSQIEIGGKEAVGIFATGKKEIIVNEGKMLIGDGSFGHVIRGEETKIGLASTSPVNLGNNATYIYSVDKLGTIKNSTEIISTGNKNYGLYAAGNVQNNANINMGNGIGNIGIYSIAGGTAINGSLTSGTQPTITVSESDIVNKFYGIGMAAGYTNDNGVTQQNGTIINYGTVKVEKANGIGMYATGSSSKAINIGTIELSGKNTTGMYLADNAIGENYGTIKTVPNPTNDGIIGVVALSGAVIKNYGTIKIEDGSNLTGVYLANAEIDKSSTGTIDGGIVTKQQLPTSKKVAGINIIALGNGTATIIRDGETIEPTYIDTVSSLAGTSKVKVGTEELDLRTTGLENIPSMARASEIGMYVDTSGVNYTNPIQGLHYLTNLKKVDLIFGSEATRYTDSKNIKIGTNILKPYNEVITSLSLSGGKKFSVNSANLTWIATATQNKNDLLNAVYLTKIPYTAFAKEQNTENFLEGLEERYGVEGIGTREKELFNKLNSLGKGEGHILVQAIDEMMGHQYANVQQRVHETSRILDKEFKYLKNEWRTMSKDSNKIKVFGMRGEYSTDTAGIIDYKSNAYGVAYLGENETFKLGETSGWYTGLVENTFKFKDIGNSKEKQLQGKLGIFKSKAFDDNNSLNWTISGEGFVGYNKMERRYLVVDEIFGAKSNYWSYGVALRNELSKDFRMTESTNFKVYGAVKAEYGRYEKIKEKSGEVRLEVKSNDYLSIKPEIGAELGYKKALSNRYFLNTKLNVAYENELGELSDVDNKARVGYTSADWYTLRSEKEDRRGNVKTDLSIGLDNERYGITANIGYDTKGKNRRAGLGLRVIF